MIEVEGLEKTFWLAKHHRGLVGALLNLVTREGRAVRAVDGISFRVAAVSQVTHAAFRRPERTDRVKNLGSLDSVRWGRISGRNASMS